MTLTLLLDLDDTLLSNPFDPFLSAYLKAWGKYIHPKLDPELFTRQLLLGTRAMVHNTDPGLTLEQAFDAVFYPALGMNKAELQTTLDCFYDQVYPDLRGCTAARPGAQQLVSVAMRKGCRLAVATNPLFPRSAILQRLEWAGFPPGDYPFEVISSFETFHFSKPSPLYYAEFLGQLGWPTDPVVMIGNSYTDDIQPSRSIGIQAYLVTEEGNEIPPEGATYPLKGSLKEAAAWLEDLDPCQYQPDYSSQSATRAILQSTPAALGTLARRYPVNLWNVRPAAGEWCLTEILCHLRDVEREVNLPRLKLLCDQENPFIAGIDTDPWAEERGYIHQDGQLALQAFLEIRRQSLEIIAEIEPKDWQKSVRHAIFGPSTGGEIIGFYATHDRSHLKQIIQNMSLLAVKGSESRN